MEKRGGMRKWKMERRYAKHGRDRKAVCTCSSVGIVFLSLISLSPLPEVPPQDLPRRKCIVSLLGHKASVKCSVLIIYRTKGTQPSPSDSYLLKSSSQSCGRGETDEEKKGKEGVTLGFFFWLVTVDLRKDKKDHIGLLQSLRAPSVLSIR